MITIKGKIIFIAGAPSSIQNGSLLTVKYEDVSLADASSKLLGEMTKEIMDYKEGDVFTYEIKCDRPRCPQTSVCVLSCYLIKFSLVE